MWVFAGGMFRSGSTLQYQLVSELIERAGAGERTEWLMPEEFGPLAERLGKAGDERRPMRVFKTHVCKHPMRERLRDGRALALRVHRDLRDVIVSGAQKAGIEPDAAYAREMTLGCLACENGWPDCPSVRSWSYARLTLDTAGVVSEMGEHLGVPCSPVVAEDLAASFGPMRQRARIERALAEGRMRQSVPGSDNWHADGDLLHANHLKDGRTGKWRDGGLPEEALRVVEDLAGDWLLARGYELSGASFSEENA